MNDATIRQQTVSIISDQFGRETGYLYQRYFEHKSTDEMLTTLAELLHGFVGEKKTKEIIQHLYEAQSSP